MHISKHHAFVGILTATFFIVCFTSRLIPAPISDRAIFISVAEYLLSGDRLYVDIYDNKDPLFFYAVSVQRLLGPMAEYLFELLLIAVSAGSAYAIAGAADGIGVVRGRSVRGRPVRGKLVHPKTGRKEILLIAVPLLLTGVFWLPGYTTLPGTALSLLACALFLRQRLLLAGGCIGLVAFTKLIMLPLPVVFCFGYELVMWKASLSHRRFSRMTIGFVVVCATVSAILLFRGEALGYLQAQKINFFYSNGVLVDNSSLLNSFFSHLRTMFLGKKEKLVLLISLIASMGFSTVLAAQPNVSRQTKAFVAGSLSTGAMSIIVLGLTGIWSHHLQLLYFSQTLMLICIVVGLGSVSLGSVGLGTKRVSRLTKRFVEALFAIAIPFLAVALSGTVTRHQYVSSPHKVAEQAMRKMSELAEASPETKALRDIHPDGTRFARFGQNAKAIPYGTAGDKLICPEFGQYPFYSPERFDDILECVKTAPTIVVGGSFKRLDEAPAWWPIDAQKETILDNWNDFVTDGEDLLRTQYACQKLEDIRVCDSLNKLSTRH